MESSISGPRRRLLLDELIKDEHLHYDEAVITVKGGRGGNGQVVAHGAGKYVKNHKYNYGYNTPKKLWLPSGAPADGGSGGDVVLICDPALDSLSHFHLKDAFVAKKGPNGNPEEGSQGSRSLAPSMRPRRDALPFLIKVPPGTVVKRKGGGHYMGELIKPGDILVVAKGGRGGYGTVVPSRKKKPQAKKSKKQDREIERFGVEERGWREDIRGMPGEERTLNLMLRIVADVGFVGLPNVGKSALLAALSRARPKIANYPFTTLIPNLGVMGHGGDPILVDLPGLIEGAHVGRGLGRNFLRHLRRTRILLHVVDVSQPEPVIDYEAIREELRMYNPEYCRRKHLVALNKVDLVSSPGRVKEIEEGIVAVATRMQEKVPDSTSPVCVLQTCAITGEGVEELQTAVHHTMESVKTENVKSIPQTVLVDFDAEFMWND